MTNISCSSPFPPSLSLQALSSTSSEISTYPGVTVKGRKIKRTPAGDSDGGRKVQYKENEKRGENKVGMSGKDIRNYTINCFFKEKKKKTKNPIIRVLT